MTLYDYDFGRLGGFVAVFSEPGRKENLYFGPFQTLAEYREWYDRVFAGRFDRLPERLSGVVTPMIHPAAEIEWERPYVEVKSWDDIKPEEERQILPFGITKLDPVAPGKPSGFRKFLRWLR